MQQTQPSERQRQQGDAWSLTDGQRLVIWVLRQSGRGQSLCRHSGTIDLRGMGRELAGIAETFGALLKRRPDTNCAAAVQLGLPGCVALTKDERRLLNVIAAAQAGDDVLVDNYLYRLALERAARGRLAEAAMKLAACLAVHGYWLPCPLGA